MYKDDDLALLIPLAQDLQQPQKPIRFWPNLNALCDVAVDNTAATNLDLNRVMEDLAGKGLYGPREGCTEHDGLPIRADVGHDAHDLQV